VLRLEAGDRFDFAEWQTDRDRLEQFYWQQGRLVARVGATRADTADGIVLTYEIAAGPRTAVVVSGADLSRDVVARLERAWAQSVFDDFLVDEAVQIVKSALANEGYLRAVVTARLVSDGDSRRLEVAVDRGVQTVTTVVRIEGPEAARIAELEGLLDARGVTRRAATDPGAVEREVTGYLRERGFLRARVTVGAPFFEERTAIVPVTIDTGPSFVLGEVTFEGVPDVSVNEVRSAASLTEGTPYEAAAADAARDRVVTFLRREGFASAEADLRETVRDTVVDLTISITPGPRQSVGEVAVTGNRAIDADVISRAFRLAPGDPLRADDLLRARTRVFDTGLFRRADVTAEPLESASGADGRLPMRVRIAVEEWPALRTRYGFQIAEERPEGEIEGRNLAPGLSADITRRTLFGRAVTVGAAAEIQRRERGARAFMTAPTLMGFPVSSSLIVERAREESASVGSVINRSAVSWEQRSRIRGNLTLSYAYKFEWRHIFRPSPDPNIPSIDDTVRIARLTGVVARDTRDDPADTVRGSLLSSSLEYAPEALGSGIWFVRYVAQSYFFRPWGSVVFASAARFGAARPLGGQRLIPSELFYAGGARTVRGIEEDSIRGRDFVGNPIGGRALLVLNQEVRMPIYRWLRGVGFIDAGNVFSAVRDLSLTDLAGAVGVGLRLATPVGTVRADYGRRVWPGPAEASGRWTFGLGQAF
jgi:outer membrane protein assembly factor BamA